jgi:hypothetical protein
MSITKIAAAAVLVLSGALLSMAGELRPETLAGWNEYIGVEKSLVAGRPEGGPFLWSDETPGRSQRVHNGEIVIAPVGDNIPKKVQRGLIHHWIGATFLPNTRLEDVFRVVRDYGRYKEFYAPVVIDSKPIHNTGTDYKFSMTMLNEALFSKTALDSDFEESYVRLDEKRWYSIAYSTRIQEINNYGQPGQRELPVNAGNGYVWRLYSISRFEERGGGVLVELEAMALSRDVPASLHWVVNPIVRRVAKGSLSVSLGKTQEAVRSRTAPVQVAGR